MRWGEKGPVRTTYRIVQRYAWWPTAVYDGTKVWLEWYYQVQRFSESLRQWIDWVPYGDPDMAMAYVEQENARIERDRQVDEALGRLLHDRLRQIMDEEEG